MSVVGLGAIRFTEYDADLPVAVIVGVLGVFVLFVGVLAAQLTRARLERARMDAVTTAQLANAAAALGLGEPRLVGSRFVRWVCTGKLCDLDAELGASGRWGRVAVSLAVEGLLGDVRVTPRPTGRGVEDYYIGAAVDSGHARFDAHYCLYGSNACSGEALTEAAKTVPRTVLDFAADHFDPAYEVVLSANELVVQPVWEPMREPSDDLVVLWRYADRLVRDGLDRAVLRSKR